MLVSSSAVFLRLEIIFDRTIFLIRDIDKEGGWDGRDGFYEVNMVRGWGGCGRMISVWFGYLCGDGLEIVDCVGTVRMRNE